jgi:hypothetical protein
MEEKPGYKTSEFWLTLVTIVLTMLASAGVFGEQSNPYKVIEIGLGILAAMGYSFSRSSVKKALPPKEDDNG